MIIGGGLCVQEAGGSPLLQLVGLDWFKSKQRQDHLAARPACVVQKASDHNPFFCVINLQVSHHRRALQSCSLGPCKDLNRRLWEFQ